MERHRADVEARSARLGHIAHGLRQITSERRICQANGIVDWDLAAAYEAMARASRVAGDDAGLARYRAATAEALERVADPEDRQLIAADLATLG